MNKTLKQVKQDISFYRKTVNDDLNFWWLGQAGFLICIGNLKFLIDPYLSDFLSVKYKGTEFPHERMMPPPISMYELTDIDYCLCSHSHSDHMDPGLIPVLSSLSPSCRFVVPEAVREIAAQRGVPEGKITAIDAGRKFEAGSSLFIHAIPAAHETLDRDSSGNYFFLGFILEFGPYTIYHSGDCIPYPELDNWLEPYEIDLALMPVNGRREELSSKGILGNFNISEVCRIVRKHDIKYAVPHHFGMFEFNTVSRESIESVVSESGLGGRINPAETGIRYSLGRL